MADFDDVAEIIKSRSGSPFNPDGSRTYIREWRVLTSNKRLGPNQICRAPGLPKPYSIYFTADGGDADVNAVLIRYTAEKEHPDEWKSWIVRAEYSTAVVEGGIPPVSGLGGQNFGFQNNPEQERPVVRWDTEVVTRALPKDLDGKAFINSAGQPFSPAPTFETARAVLVIERNELKFDRATATNYAFAVNSDRFLGVGPGKVRCNPITATQMFRGNLSFWRVSYRLVFGAQKFPTRTNAQTDAEGVIQAATGIVINLPFSVDDDLESWQPEFLNAGTMKLVPAALVNIPFVGTPVPILKNHVPITQPVLLNSAGTGEVTVNADGSFTPNYVQFRVYRERPFNVILAGALGGL